MCYLNCLIIWLHSGLADYWILDYFVWEIPEHCNKLKWWWSDCQNACPLGQDKFYTPSRLTISSARQEIQLFQNTKSHILLTKANIFGNALISRVQQYIYQNLFSLVRWMRAKKRTQTISHWVIWFNSFEQLFFFFSLTCKKAFYAGGSICAD